MFLFLLILDVIALVVFAKMTFYVAGSVLGILIVLTILFIKRRRNP